MQQFFQNNKLEKLLHLVGDLFELYDDDLQTLNKCSAPSSGPLPLGKELRYPLDSISSKAGL
jgi:hypothetical protein